MFGREPGVHKVVASFTVVFSDVTQGRSYRSPSLQGATLRDILKNGSEGDYRLIKSNLFGKHPGKNKETNKRFFIV